MILKICCLLLGLTAICASDKFYDECGLEATSVTPLVRGGQTVGAYEFPWQVAIFRRKGEEFEQICGGSLVTSTLVITAAHCFSAEAINHQIYVDDYRVVGGSLLSNWTALTPRKQTTMVRAVHLGEQYGGYERNYQDDIALVQLETEFNLSRAVRTVCLDLMDRELDNTQTSLGNVGKVAGWGFTDSGKVSDILTFLRVPVVGDKQCMEQFLTPSSTLASYITTDKLCAGLNNGSAVCPGDSGGGLVFSQQNTDTSPPRWYLRGVLSNAPTSRDLNNPCRIKVFALYTRVFKHRVWLSRMIEELQPQDGCRVKGSAGKCREYSACPRAMEEAARGILPQYCSPSSNKICCVETCPPLPPSAVSQRKTGSKAQDYCVDLAEKLYPCQQNGSSWSRGDLCGPNPEEHRLQYRVVPLPKASDSAIQRYGFLSTGVGAMQLYLISERWFLTNVQAWEFLLGYPARNITSEVVFSPRRIVPHPKYQPAFGSTRATNNIILVEMDMPVRLSTFYRPLCLHTAQENLEGLMLNMLYEVTRNPVILLSQEQCRREFPPGSWGAPSGVTDSHLCVTRSGGLCGNPWEYIAASNRHRVACTQLLVGLFLGFKKEGSICTELYLRLSSYIPWVESVVWP